MAAVIKPETWYADMVRTVRQALRQSRVSYSVSRRELSDITKEIARIRRQHGSPSKRLMNQRNTALRSVAASRRSLIQAMRAAEHMLGREQRF